MSVRTIAQAIPLVLAVACTTSSTQRASDHTGAMWPQRATARAQPASTPGAATQETSAQTEQGSQTSSPSSAPVASDSSTMSGQVQGETSAAASPDTGSTGSGSTASGSTGTSGSTDTPGSSEPMGSSGSGPGGTAEPGAGPMGGGPSDHGQMGSDAGAAGSPGAMVGRISKVSGKSLSIKSAQGESKTLKIVPETVVTVNGKTVKPSQIKAGRPVRASYNEQDGQDVAVRIDVGRTPAAGGSNHRSTSNGK